MRTSILVALALALAGCSAQTTGGTESAAGGSGPSLQPTTSASAQPSASKRPVFETVPGPQRLAFTEALEGIDPGLTSHPERHLRRAVDVCYDVFSGKPDDVVVRNAALRYDGPRSPVGEHSAKAKQIVAAAKKWMCTKELRAHYEEIS